MARREHRGCGGCLQSLAVGLSIVLQYCGYHDSPNIKPFVNKNMKLKCCLNLVSLSY